MPRLVRCSLMQAHTDASPDLLLADIKRAMIDKHPGCIRQAATAGAGIVCLQGVVQRSVFLRDLAKTLDYFRYPAWNRMEPAVTLPE